MLDDDLIEAFESLTLAEFRHRDHLQLGFAMLRREGDFGAAAVRFRRALKRFAEARGVPGKYHETLTWAYLAIIWERIHAAPAATFEELLVQFPDLLDSALDAHYDVAAITASPVARTVFVLPTRR